jgi:hypothetical protein
MLFLVALAMPLQGCTKQEPVFGTSQPAAEIHGRISDCFGKEVVYRRNLPVYIYTLEQSVGLRKKLGEMEKAKSAAGGQRVLFAVLNQIAGSRPTIPPTKTDELGQFSFGGLRPGDSYLIVAADLKYDDFIAYRITEKIRAGSQQIETMGPKRAADCAGGPNLDRPRR